jgi:Fe-S-cluster-containing dehydrogenase component
MKRRNFFKIAGFSAGLAAFASRTSAKSDPDDETMEFSGILTDTTRCLGCLNCETVCAEANGLPEPDYENFTNNRKTTPSQWTVVNDYEVGDELISVKKQCMHCFQPACASACLTKAMEKTELGPVIWHENKCMGCRACMISCPFEIPKFEANSPNPKIQKCRMCFERIQEGEKPACVENCVGDALVFGKRRELIDIAKTRIYAEPDKYNHHIYGEREVGGTGFIYLASASFDQLGFNMNVGNTPYPEYTRGFLYSVPLILILWPVFLLGLSDSIKGEKVNSIKELDKTLKNNKQ